MSAESRGQPRYLGDGVYASFDGYQVWLRVDGACSIALEPAVWAQLVAYVDALKAADDELTGLRDGD